MDIVKSFHIIAVVAWFSGLFYLGRLFIYHQLAASQSDSEKKLLQSQYELMMTRVARAIMGPAAIITVLLGLHLAQSMGVWMQPWMHVKLTLVILLLGYHGACEMIRVRLARGRTYSVTFFRYFNELATVFLVLIVLLVVTKQIGFSLVATLGFWAVVLPIFLVSRLFKR